MEKPKPKCLFCGSEDVAFNKGLSDIASNLSGYKVRIFRCGKCLAHYGVDWPSDEAYEAAVRMFKERYDIS